MSFPVLKDLDKSINDLINDDFDSKYTLKVKSSGPNNTNLTNTTAYDSKEGKLVPKLALKWGHESGFTLEKFEVSQDAKFVVETSLVNAAPGLKLEFKGNDGDKADLSFTYNAPVATLTGEVDLISLSSAKTTVVGGQGPVVAGASAEFKLSSSTLESTTLGLGVSYTVPKTVVAVARADKNFSKYTAGFNYTATPEVSVAGQFTYAKDASAVLATSYKCNPNTTIKVKANTNGVFAASVKQSFEKKFSVVASAELPGKLDAIKFGVNATLG